MKVSKKLLVAFLLLATGLSLSAQQKIAGTVKDASGQPVIGAGVTVQGTTIGTVTSTDGTYSVSVPSNSTIQVSCIGYVTKSFKVTPGQALFNVTLVEDATLINDVVVIGYGTMKKSDFSGALSTVSSSEFKIGSNLTAQSMMAGAFSGVQVSQNSGKPGGSTTIRVRGGTSVNYSNEPLYVIDGVPISSGASASRSTITTNTYENNFDQEPENPLAGIDPNDIESISVLKDASATAIYGSRGANGVVMITTKKGKAGVKSLEYSFNLGVSNAASKLSVLNGDEYRSICNENNIKFTDGGTSTDWQDQIMRTAFSRNHHISFMSGSGNTNYMASLNYANEEGILKGSDVKRGNVRVNINHAALNDKLKLNLNMNYGINKSNQAPNPNTVRSEMGSCQLYEAYVFNPTLPIYDADGDYVDLRPYRVNPVSFASEIPDTRDNNNFIVNLSVDRNFGKEFTFNANVGLTNNLITRDSYISKSNLRRENDNGYVDVQHMKDYSNLLELTLKYDKVLGKHSINALAGYSYQSFYEEGDQIQAGGFISDEFKWYNIGAASTIKSATSYTQSNKLISFYARALYNYDNKYFLTATVRRDGSSRFGADHKWGTFPSFAASWRISQEDFMSNTPFNNLKLRASWGITGNQEIGNYNSLNTLGATGSSYIINGKVVTIILPQQYSNPDIKWEETRQLDLGVDFGLWEDRLHGTVDFYDKKTSDLLLSVAVPAPSLITSQTANVGSVSNKGVELELGYDIFKTKDFLWSVTVNATHNENKLVSLSNDKWTGANIKTAPCQGPGLSGPYSQLIMEGYPLGTFYGAKFLRVEGGQEIFEGADGTEVTNAYKALQQVIGCAQPKLVYGLSTNLQFKKWFLNANLRGTLGNDVYNCTSNNLMYLTNLPGRNVLKAAVSSGVAANAAKYFSSRFIEDASFARLDNLTLGYVFDNIKLLGIKQLKAYATAQNLFVLTKYSGLDPEVNSEISSTGTAPLGVDYLSYPRARTFTLGLNVAF